MTGMSQRKEICPRRCEDIASIRASKKRIEDGELAHVLSRRIIIDPAIICIDIYNHLDAVIWYYNRLSWRHLLSYGI